MRRFSRQRKEHFDIDALSRAPVGDVPEKTVDELVDEVLPDLILGQHNLSVVAAVTS